MEKWEKLLSPPVHTFLSALLWLPQVGMPPLSRPKSKGSRAPSNTEAPFSPGLVLSKLLSIPPAHTHRPLPGWEGVCFTYREKCALAHSLSPSCSVFTVANWCFALYYVKKDTAFGVFRKSFYLKSCFREYCLIMDPWKSTLIKQKLSSGFPILGLSACPWKHLLMLWPSFVEGQKEPQVGQRTLSPPRFALTFCAAEFLLESRCWAHIRISRLPSHLCVAVWFWPMKYERTFECQFQVDIVYMWTFFLWALPRLLPNQLGVNIGGDLESPVFILAGPLSAWIPARLYGADDPCPFSFQFKNKLVSWVVTWDFSMYFFYQLVPLQPIKAGVKRHWSYIFLQSIPATKAK